MKAVVVLEPGGACVVRDVELVPPGPGEVRMRVAAAGVCHTDLSYRDGTLGDRTPFVPGHEGSGVVIETGPGVARVSPGDHVVLNWIPACGLCPSCRRGEFHLCAGGPRPSKHLLDGTTLHALAGIGAFAEETVVPEAAVVPIPPDVPLDAAALLGCAVTTGVGAAVNTAAVSPGSSVLVIGCGGVGLNVIQGARVCGAAAIVGVDRVAGRLGAAKAFGATHAVTPEGLEAVSAEVTEDGFDYAFEAVGAAATIRAAWDATRRGGCTVVVGAGSSADTVQLSAFELFATGRRLVGSLYGSADPRRDVPRFLRLWRAGRLELDGLISRRIALDEVEGAFERMLSGEGLREVIAP